MHKLSFSNGSYKEFALNITNNNYNIHKSEDAFLLLINGLPFNDLENLCHKIKDFYSKSFNSNFNLSLEDCYKLTQNTNLPQEEKNIIKNLALECLKEGKHLGNNTILDGKINTSSWLSHSIFMSESCAALANCLNLDVDKARTLGLLHDFGRKYDHSFNHAIKGFEKLCDFGWYGEAIGCITHSFVNGGRCSNNEPAIDGFFIDEYGNPNWKDSAKKDDITLFLEKYDYNEYDLILNIADLISTDKGLVSPSTRIADIATRRTIDPTNRGYFIADFTNLLIDFLNAINTNINNFKKIKAHKNISIDEINNYFNTVANQFFKNLLELNNQKKDSHNFFNTNNYSEEINHKSF